MSGLDRSKSERSELSELLATFEQLCHEGISTLLHAFRCKVIDQLLVSSQRLEGVDMLSTSGKDITDGIRELLLAAKDDLSTIGIDNATGIVTISTLNACTGVARLYVPAFHVWSRQSFASVLSTWNPTECMCVPYTVDPIASAPDQVSFPPAFVLSSEEQIAAQILMMRNVLRSTADALEHGGTYAPEARGNMLVKARSVISYLRTILTTISR